MHSLSSDLMNLDHADDGTQPIAHADDYNPLHGRSYAYRISLTNKLCEALDAVAPKVERRCNTVFMLPTNGRWTARVEVNGHNVCVTTTDLSGGSHLSEDTLPRGLTVWEIAANLYLRSANLCTTHEADVPF